MKLPLVNPRLDLNWLARHATGKGADVAVIDSGIDAAHPALQGRIHRACVVARNPKGELQPREIPVRQCTDSFGHGTAVAGIIADLAPEARLVSVQVLDDYDSCTGDVLIAGLKWALDQNIRLINLSLATTKPLWFPALFELCERAFVQNTILVAARRNFGDLGCPAMFSSVISVDREDYAEPLRIHYRPKDIIQFDARGTRVKVLASNSAHAIQTGTSFATAHVSAVVALLLEVFPNLTAAEAKTALKAFSDGRKNTSSKRTG